MSTFQSVSLVRTISDYSLVELQVFLKKKNKGCIQNCSIKTSKEVLKDLMCLKTFDLWPMVTSDQVICSHLFSFHLFVDQQIYCLIRYFFFLTFQSPKPYFLFAQVSLLLLMYRMVMFCSQWGHSALHYCSLILARRSSCQTEHVGTMPRNCYYWLNPRALWSRGQVYQVSE